MLNLVSTFLARIIAGWVAGFCAWLLTKHGIEIGFEDQAKMVEHLVGIILPTFITVYAIVHRLISKRTNPGDAAGGHLAKKEARESAQIKMVEG